MKCKLYPLKDCWNLVLHLIQMSLQLTQTEINNLTGTIGDCLNTLKTSSELSVDVLDTVESSARGDFPYPAREITQTKEKLLKCCVTFCVMRLVFC